jgi:hypothetical protein
MEEIRSELDRVGASYAKVGAADYVAINDLRDGTVALVGQPRPPRRRWRGEGSSQRDAASSCGKAPVMALAPD